MNSSKQVQEVPLKADSLAELKVLVASKVSMINSEEDPKVEVPSEMCLKSSKSSSLAKEEHVEVQESKLSKQLKGKMSL